MKSLEMFNVIFNAPFTHSVQNAKLILLKPLNLTF